jgi:hypothetical protein
MYEQQLHVALALFALCEVQLARGTRRAEVWTYISDQVARNVQCTLGFEALGAVVPLARAVELRAVATEELVRCKHSLATTALLVRAMARWHEGEVGTSDKSTVGQQLGLWVRQVLVHTVVMEVQQLAIAEDARSAPPPGYGGASVGIEDPDVLDPLATASTSMLLGPGRRMGVGPAAAGSPTGPTGKSDFDGRFDALYLEAAGAAYSAGGSVRRPKSTPLPDFARACGILLPDLWRRCKEPLNQASAAIGGRLALSSNDALLLFGVLRVTSPGDLVGFLTPLGTILHMAGTSQAFNSVWMALGR